MPPADTKSRILDAAEAVFAEQGFDGASLRAITTRAGANLAAVHYHFGSKEALFHAVYGRRIGPINRVRLERLEALEASGEEVTVEALVRAFVEPACSIVHAGRAGGARFLRLSGRMFSEPGEHWQAVRVLFAEIQQRYLDALARALPGQRPEEVFWRMHFLIGAMCHALAAGPLLSYLSEGTCDGDDLDQAVEELLPFLAAGLRAPPARARSTQGGAA